MITLGLNRALLFGGKAGASTPTPWILAENAWNDSGVWIDSETWND